MCTLDIDPSARNHNGYFNQLTSRRDRIRGEGNQKTENNMKGRSEPQTPTRCAGRVPPTSPAATSFPGLPAAMAR